MKIETQILKAPDRPELVVLKRADFGALIEAWEDAEDAIEGHIALKQMEAEGGMPGEVLNGILDQGLTPSPPGAATAASPRPNSPAAPASARSGSAASKTAPATANPAPAPRSLLLWMPSMVAGHRES